jgi:SAM-dependent methyltransferase
LNQRLKPKRPKLLVTKNQMGWASEQLNDVSTAFVDFCRTGFCSSEESRALDIGAAFGTAAIAALRAGAQVIANDLEAEHLAVLRERVAADAGLGPKALERLRTQPARFPRETWFVEHTIGAVHASNVFHFLTGNQLERGITAISQWLRPGGKLFVHAVTPYQTAFAPFIEEYERRLAAGDRWPGWIPKLSVWSRHKKFGQMPRSIHLLDDIVLRRVADAAGLTVERVWLYRRKDQPVSLCMDGRESVGLIAVKF